MESKKQLLQKMHNIMKEITFIAKDKKNDFHNYDYASEKAIKQELHKHLTQQKVLFRVDVVDAIQSGTLTLLKMKYFFTDVESGEEITGEFMGSGEDKGDKGVYKAITGAIKYILTSSFLIPTGEDPESESKPTNKTGNPAQHNVNTSTGEIRHCPNCNEPTKYIKAGVSKEGKPYKAFWACQDKACNTKFY